jgi:hypothetical protein
MLLDESKQTKSPYTVLDYRNEQNGAFLCRVSDLHGIYLGMITVITGLIDLLVAELNAGSGDGNSAREFEMEK